MMGKAFRGHVSGCRRDCECGIVYWDAFNVGYDWEENEIEELQQLEAQGKAKSLDHSVGVIELEGRYYVDGCRCWHERAVRVARWILAHGVPIAEFLKENKKLLMREAETAPTV